MKSGNLNFLEPSGPLQACNGTALPLPLLQAHNAQHGSAVIEISQNTHKEYCYMSLYLGACKIRHTDNARQFTFILTWLTSSTCQSASATSELSQWNLTCNIYSTCDCKLSIHSTNATWWTCHKCSCGVTAAEKLRRCCKTIGITPNKGPRNTSWLSTTSLQLIVECICPFIQLSYMSILRVTIRRPSLDHLIPRAIWRWRLSRKINVCGSGHLL
jgi:hypothetical protein